MTTEIGKRESLYGEFIAECSKLLIDAMDHTLDTPSKFLDLYAIANRIRLTSSNEVLTEAEQTIRTILKLYLHPNITDAEIRERALAATSDQLKAMDDPLKPFSDACRSELAELRYLH